MIIKTYKCIECQDNHFEGDERFDIHLSKQSKEGIVTADINDLINWDAFYDIIHQRCKNKLSSQNHVRAIDTIREWERLPFSNKDLTKVKNILNKLYSDYDGRESAFKDYISLDCNDNLKNVTNGIGRFYISQSPKFYAAIHDILSKCNQGEKDYLEKHYNKEQLWFFLALKFKMIDRMLNPTKEEREAKRLEQIKGKVDKRIGDIIDNIAENFRLIIEAREYEYFIKICGEFTEKWHVGCSRNTLFSFYDKNREKLSNILRCLQMDKNNIFTLLENYREKAAMIAVRNSEMEILSFSLKMYDKLGGLIAPESKEFSVEYKGGVHSNVILFKLGEGNGFTVINKIVYGVNQWGTGYYQYPTTFHDATVSGKKIPSPNELAVKKMFIRDFKSQK